LLTPGFVPLAFSGSLGQILQRLPILILGLLFWCVVAADEITGRVVGVADGDTLTILNSSRTQHKIRLNGIDAPEKKQPYGSAAKQHLWDLAYGKQARAACYKRDRYGREVCSVLVDGKDVGLAQLDGGLVVSEVRSRTAAPRAYRVRVSRG
jgi:endonuclease YncB( thermonuclease family)